MQNSCRFKVGDICEAIKVLSEFDVAVLGAIDPVLGGPLLLTGNDHATGHQFFR